jgi:hypothetical protein
MKVFHLTVKQSTNKSMDIPLQVFHSSDTLNVDSILCQLQTRTKSTATTKEKLLELLYFPILDLINKITFKWIPAFYKMFLFPGQQTSSILAFPITLLTTLFFWAVTPW